VPVLLTELAAAMTTMAATTSPFAAAPALATTATATSPLAAAVATAAIIMTWASEAHDCHGGAHLLQLLALLCPLAQGPWQTH
jgi:hypothetical protein